LVLLLTLILGVVLTTTSALAVNSYLNDNFNTNPDLTATNTDGAWYPDRYPPAAFASTSLNGENVLKISISAADGAQLRPGGLSGGFYNTQGRKFNQEGLGVTKLSGDLYIPADWATSHRRSDMWSTAFNASNVVSFYPIIGFRNIDGASPNLSYWDGGAWVNLGAPSAYNVWYSFAMELDGSDILYKVNGAEVGRLSSNNSTYFGNIILQAFNFNDNTLGVSYNSGNAYDAFWDNIKTATITPFYNVTADTYHPTLQAAITAATAGDTIEVAAGTYTENLTVNKALTINGAQAGVVTSGRTAQGPNESTIAGDITLANVSNVTIDGFTLKNPGGARAIYLNNSNGSTPVTNVHIRNNFITEVGTTSSCVNVHVIYFNGGPDNITIEGNHFSNLRANRSVSAIGVLDTAATNSSTGLLIQNNIIEDVVSTFSNACPTASPRGAYGIIINNAVGAPGAQILNNFFADMSGAWTHAVGLEGPTQNAVVLNNQFSGLAATGMDKSAVHFEKNPAGSTASVMFNQFNGTNFFGVAINPNDLPGGSNGLNYIVDARHNWWGNASGPSDAGLGTQDPVTGAAANGSGAHIGANVRFDEWLRPGPATVTLEGLAPTETLNGPDGSSATNDGSNSFLVVLSKFTGNPSNVPNFAGASAFYDIFVSGATTSDSLTVVLPAAGDGFLYFYTGSEWVEVLNGDNPISPSGGFYNFTLDNDSTPKLTELDGTPFTGAGNEEIRITPSTTTIAAGETFQVVVEAGSDALFGVDVSLNFSTTVFSVTNIALGSGLTPGTIAVNTYDNGAGTLRFAYSQLGSSMNNVTGTDLVLATITFLAHTDGDGEIALGAALFTDKDGNPATPAPLDSPIALTIDPSPTVFVDVALQGRNDHAGLQLEVKPVSTGNILYDNVVTAGRLEIANVPAGSYKARVSAPKYLAAIQDFTLLATESSRDLVGPLVLRGGDINGDDQINIQDLVVIGVNFGSTIVLTPDINGDSVVNIQDLAIAAGNFTLKTGGPSFSGYPGNWE